MSKEFKEAYSAAIGGLPVMSQFTNRHDCEIARLQHMFTAGRALGRREMNPYKVALAAATEFINSHVADPDITAEMTRNHAAYLAAIEAIPEVRAKAE